MWDSTGKIRMTNIKRSAEEAYAKAKQTAEHLAGLIATLDAGNLRDEMAKTPPMPNAVDIVMTIPEEATVEEILEEVVEELEEEVTEEEAKDEEVSSTEAAIAEIKALLAKLTGKE